MYADFWASHKVVSTKADELDGGRVEMAVRTRSILDFVVSPENLIGWCVIGCAGAGGASCS